MVGAFAQGSLQSLKNNSSSASPSSSGHHDYVRDAECGSSKTFTFAVDLSKFVMKKSGLCHICDEGVCASKGRINADNAKVGFLHVTFT